MWWSDADALPAVLPRDQFLDCSINPLIRRIAIDGKFLSADGEIFFVRGVTYGAFRPDESGREYADDRLIDRDFAQMAAVGINTVLAMAGLGPLIAAAQVHAALAQAVDELERLDDPLGRQLGQVLLADVQVGPQRQGEGV